MVFKIITITYNRSQLMFKALQSVLEQTYRDFEYYIVDNGSNDDTAEMIRRFNDARIRIFRLETNARLSVARNVALDHAGAGVIVMLDSDDSWEKDYLKTLAELYSNQHPLSVIANAWTISGNHKYVLFSIELLRVASKDPLLAKLQNDAFTVYTSCFSFVQSDLPARFDESFPYGEDELITRIMAQGRTMILSEPLVNILKHADSTSASLGPDPFFNKGYAEALESLRRLNLSGRVGSCLYRRIASKYFFKLGNSFLNTGNRRKAKENYSKAVLTYPLNIKALIKYFFVFVR